MFCVKIATVLAVTALAQADLAPSDLAPIARLFRSRALRELGQEINHNHLARRQSSTTSDDDEEECPQLQNVFLTVFGSRANFMTFYSQCDSFFSGLDTMFQPNANYDIFCQSPCSRPAMAAFDAAGTMLRGACPRMADAFGLFGMLMNSIVCSKTANNEYCADKFAYLESPDITSNLTNLTSLCNFTDFMGCCARQITSLLTNPLFASFIPPEELSNATQHLGTIEAVYDVCNAPGACALPTFPASSITFIRPVMAAPIVTVNFNINPSGLNEAVRAQIEQQVRDNVAATVGANSVKSVSLQPDGSGGIRVTVEFVDSVSQAQTAGLGGDAQITNMTVTYTDANGNNQTSQTTGASVATTGGGGSASIATPMFAVLACLVAVLVM